MASDSKASEQKKPSSKIIAALAVLAILIIGVIALQNREKPPVVENTPAPPAQVAQSEPVAQGAVRPPENETPPPAEEEAKEPESNAERAYLIEDFRDKNKNWSNYKMTGVRVTDEGIVMEDGQTNGVVESPTMTLQLPSNLVALLWKEERPDGAFISPEMQISADGQNWSSWYPIESTGDDINPLYPDGTPNPNYGYVPGGYVSLGLELIPFIRYKFTMSRLGVTTQSPTMKGIRFYHLDSTLGEGRMATPADYPPGPPSAEQLQEQQRAQQEEVNQVPQVQNPPPGQ